MRQVSDLPPPGVPTGKRVRLHRIRHGHGTGNGRMLLLPYDQGFEHGPRDFFPHPVAADPGYVIRLAVEGGFNGIVLHIGNARRFFWEYAGEVPLILKLNGKTEIPSDHEAFSPCNASVEEAVQLGADAVGYTIYVGSPRQADDLLQYQRVRQDAERLGMPLIVWSYPRGSAVEEAGGKNSFYAIDYATRLAAELSADVVKINWPDPGRRHNVPTAYNQDFSSPEMLRAIVNSAGRSLVLLSGGEKSDDQLIFQRARVALEAGISGLIFGRNVWQREHDESLRFAANLRELLSTIPDSRISPVGR